MADGVHRIQPEPYREGLTRLRGSYLRRGKRVACNGASMRVRRTTISGLMNEGDKELNESVEARARQRGLQRRATWMMTHTITDLRARADSADEYTLLGIAGILRRAIIDQHSLAGLQRSRLRLAGPEFRYRPAPIRSDPIRPSSIPLGTQVRFPVLGRFREPEVAGSLRAFRQAAVATANGGVISVEDLIKHFAHVEGGVHVGYPEGDAQDALSLIFGFRTDGWRHGLGLLGDIAYVAANGLEPLMDSRLPVANAFLGGTAEVL